MRTFLGAYENMAEPLWVVSREEAYAALMAKKEAALRGWIAYCVLCNGGERGLSTEFMSDMFGPWVRRPWTIERRSDGWVLSA